MRLWGNVSARLAPASMQEECFGFPKLLPSWHITPEVVTLNYYQVYLLHTTSIPVNAVPAQLRL